MRTIEGISRFEKSEADSGLLCLFHQYKGNFLSAKAPKEDKDKDKDKDKYKDKEKTKKMIKIQKTKSGLLCLFHQYKGNPLPTKALLKIFCRKQGNTMTEYIQDLIIYGIWAWLILGGSI